MTSKESLEELKKINRKQNNGNGDLYLECIIEPIEKDLEELEEYRKIMGTPIQDIMKRLKILDILKNIIVVVPNTKDTAGPKYYIGLRQDVILNDETKKIIMDWLNYKKYDKI